MGAPTFGRRPGIVRWAPRAHADACVMLAAERGHESIEPDTLARIIRIRFRRTNDSMKNASTWRDYPRGHGVPTVRFGASTWRCAAGPASAGL